MKYERHERAQKRRTTRFHTIARLLLLLLRRSYIYVLIVCACVRADSVWVVRYCVHSSLCIILSCHMCTVASNHIYEYESYFIQSFDGYANHDVFEHKKGKKREPNVDRICFVYATTTTTAADKGIHMCTRPHISKHTRFH